jgi:hypothetical protein
MREYFHIHGLALGVCSVAAVVLGVLIGEYDWSVGAVYAAMFGLALLYTGLVLVSIHRCAGDDET